ncbi:MAG TPA: translocation/assembly module TamB domain-containing protein [Rhodocyclaceae bacterium]|nr:translocation/assembly module TamB domain-containing protein [Rhodocyclaceae bacterium]
MSSTASAPDQSGSMRRSELRWLLVSIVIFVMGTAATIVFVVTTEIGARFGLSAATMLGIRSVQIEGWHGRLWDRWQVEQMEVSFPSIRLRVSHLDVAWHLSSIFKRHIVFDWLHAGQLEIRTPPSAHPEPVHVPASLQLPMAMTIKELRLDHLAIGTLADGSQQPAPNVVLDEIIGRLDSDANAHRIEQLAMTTPAGRVTGSARLSAKSPFALAAAIRLTGDVQSRKLTVDAQVDGTLTAPRVRLQADGDGIDGQADVLAQPFDSPPLRRAQVTLQHIDPSAFNAGAPHASISVRADLTPSIVTTPGTAASASGWRVRGPVEIVNRTAAPADDNGIPLDRMSAQIDWSQGRLTVNGLRIELPGRGLLAGQASWQPGARTPVSSTQPSSQTAPLQSIGRIEAALKISSVDPSRLYSAAQPARINGDLSASVRASDQQFKLDLAADRYILAAQGEQHNGILTLRHAELKAGTASLVASGQMALRGPRTFEAHGSLSRGDPQRFVTTAPHGNLNATFDVSGQLAPSWRAKLAMTMTDSKLDGYPVAGGGHLSLAEGRIFDADVNLNVLDNYLVLTGAFGKLGDQLRYKLDAAHLDRLLDGAGGSINARGILSGSIELPSGELVAHADQLVLPGGIHVGSADAQARLQDGPAGSFNAKVDVSAVRSGAANSDPIVRHAGLSISGKRSAHDVVLFADLLKDQHIDLRASGGLLGENWHGYLQQLVAKGLVNFRLKQPAMLDASLQGMSLGPAQLQAQNGNVQISRLEWSPQRIVTKGRITGVEVGLSLDENQNTVLSGNSMQLGGEWDVALGEQANGLVRIFREGGDIILQGDSPVAMGLETFEATLGMQNNRLAFSAIANGTRIGAINLVLSAMVQGRGSGVRLNPDAPLVGVGNIQMSSISWVGPFISPNLRTEGSVHGEFNIQGTSAKPQGAGRVQGDKLEIALADQGLRLSEGSAVLSFDAARVTLEKLVFQSDNKMRPPDSRLTRSSNFPGQLTGSGQLQLSTGKGTFTLQAERIAALQQPNQWMLVSGAANIDTGWDHFNLDAQLKADAGFVGVPKGGAPRLSDDVVVRSKKPKSPSRMRMNGEIVFDFGNQFILKAYGVDTYLDGILRLQLADDSPIRATGSVRAREGTFVAYGQKLSIERGAVNFQGPIDDPGLNVVALRKGLPVEAGVQITGTARDPHVQLVSDPNVPESEKLSWILLGRPAETGSGDAGLLLSAAGAAFGGNGEGLVDRLAHGIGLDDISVGQATTNKPLQSQTANSVTGVNSSVGTAVNSEQVLTLGKRISSRAYLGLEQNFIGTESVVKISYNLTRFLALVAQAGTDNALDLNYSLSFR